MMDALFFFILCAIPITTAFVSIGVYKTFEARRELAAKTLVAEPVLTEVQA